MKEKKPLLRSVTQTIREFQSILQDEVPVLARQSGAVKRVRPDGIDAVTLVQSLIFGWWQEPDITLAGLSQVAARREVQVSASAISQRFTPACAELLRRVLARLSEVSLGQAQAVDVALLRQFAAVIVEDSSTVCLPEALAQQWRGCGGNEGTSQAAVKLCVQWNVSTGELRGPRLAEGRCNDHQSPFGLHELEADSLYLADLGFFAIARLAAIARGTGRKRYFVTRWQPNTTLYTRRGHRLRLEGLLPQQVGQVRELGVLLGKQEPLAVRLLLVKVPAEVAHERQERLRRAAHKHGREPSAAVLKLAHWTIVLTNVPRANDLISYCTPSA
jgi:hypothetical protein